MWGIVSFFPDSEALCFLILNKKPFQTLWLYESECGPQPKNQLLSQNEVLDLLLFSNICFRKFGWE